MHKMKCPIRYLIIAAVLAVMLALPAIADDINSSTNISDTPAFYCRDNDNGQDYYRQGSIKTNYPGWSNVTGDTCSYQENPDNYVNTDSCSGDNCYVTEYLCSNDVPGRNIFQCPNGCSNGACLETSPQKPVYYCTDSDNGQDAYTQGNVKTNYPNWPAISTDTCAYDTGKGAYTDSGSCSGDACYLKDYVCNGYYPGYYIIQCKNGCTNGACIATPPTNQQPKVKIAVLGTSDDKAGQWNSFGPGAGAGGNKNDWKWYMTISLPSKKTVTALTVYHNLAGEGWSTRLHSDNLNKDLYPLVIFKDGSQVNSAYGQTIGTLDAGTYAFELYGQIETSTFLGGKFVIEFSDGTQASAAIPAYSVPVPVTHVITCSMPVCGANSRLYDTGGMDPSGCKIYACTSGCQVKTVCTDKSPPVDTGKVDNDGCPIYMCRTEQCNKDSDCPQLACSCPINRNNDRTCKCLAYRNVCNNGQCVQQQINTSTEYAGNDQLIYVYASYFMGHVEPFSQKMTPVIKQIESNLRIKVKYIDSYTEPDAAKQLGVEAFPTMIFQGSNGCEKRTDGAQSYDTFKAWLLDGECSPSASSDESVSETVRCIFTGVNAQDSEQKCYSSVGECTAKQDYSEAGEMMCDVPVSGQKGSDITWKSSCGGYQNSVIDGNDEKVVFDCSQIQTQETYLALYINQPVEYNLRGRALSLTASSMNNGDNEGITLDITDGSKTSEYSLSSGGVISYDSLYISLVGVTDSQKGYVAKVKITESNAVTSSVDSVESGTVVTSGRVSRIPQPPVSPSSGSSGSGTGQLICQGCDLDGKCISFGIRTKNGDAKYCDIDGVFKEQQGEGKDCSNNYECESNTCSSGKCIDLVAKIDIQQGMLEKLMSWIRSMFGAKAA